MFLVLAAVILVISFAIAFISLVGEERKREKLTSETDAAVGGESESSAGDLQEVASGAVGTEVDSGAFLPKEETGRTTTLLGVFPWEQDSKQEASTTSGEEEGVRLPNLSGSQGTNESSGDGQDSGPEEFLSGEIKISDIGKKREG